MNLNTTRMQIIDNIKHYNNKGKVANQFVICSIVNVNSKSYTVDVFIPSLSSKIKDVIVGTGVLSENGTTISLLPSKGQKGLLLLSSQTPPILLSTIPNKRKEHKSTLLDGEALIGNKNSMFKLSKDNSLDLKTPNSIFSINEDKQLIITNGRKIKSSGYEKNCDVNRFGYEEEIYYEVDNEDYFIKKIDFIKNSKIDEELKNSTINKSQELLNNLNSMVELVKEVNGKINLGELKSIDELTKLKSEIMEYGLNKKDKRIKILKGKKNNENSIFSISFEEGEDEKSSFIFNENGEIILNCKDLIVNRGE